MGQHYIEHVGLTLNSDISHFIKIMDTAARNKFPIHARRMKCFTHVHKGDTMTHLREIVESIKLAEWSTFNEDAAAMHIFTDIPRKICTNCKLKAHLAPDCWGRCTHCSCFGHKSQVCRSRPP